MDPAIQQLIEAIHSSGRGCVLALTGGGTQAAALLLNVPGASRTILEVVVPYHADALRDYLGWEPEQCCSAETSRAMARRAYERAAWLVPGARVLGVGCTASLVTDRPKQGEHRFHVSVHGADRTCTWSLVLTRDARDRVGEEEVLDRVILNGIAEMSGLSDRVAPTLLAAEQIQLETVSDPSLLAAFARGEKPAVLVEPDGRVRTDAEPPRVVLPGAFNPVHHGHWQLADVAAQFTGVAVAFELSAVNVDKPPLTVEEIRRRLAQFGGGAPVWLTRAPTFLEKARLFPACCFVVGVDTAVRIVSPRYYEDSAAKLDAALEELRRLGCRFLVAGRANSEGRFLHVEHVPMPAGAGDLFEPIPESAFRVDCSSTQLRAEGQAVES